MNGNLDTSDVLLNRGLNGGYYGNQGNFLGDGSAVKEAVRGNRDLALLESVNAGSRDNFLSQQIRQHNDSIGDRIDSNQDFLATKISDQGIEFRFANVTAQHAALERMMIANQQAVVAMLHAQDLKQVECCCELKAGQATIIANQESARLADAQAENVTLRNQIMFINSRGNSGNGNGQGN